MIYGHAQASLWFLAIIGLFLFHLLARRKRKKAREAFAPEDLFWELTASWDAQKHRGKVILFFAALIFCALALMRPQLGFQWEEGKRTGLDIFLAIDTSRSMRVEDVQPNRLETAKGLARNLLEKLKGDRLGLIAFSGSAFLVCPLTNDYGAFRLLLEGVDAEMIPKGGTDLAAPIREALKASGSLKASRKILVLLTDGEDHAGDWKIAAETAQKEGLKIFSVGIGTKEGGLIPVMVPGGREGFAKDRQGQMVKSGLEEGPLRQISSATGGLYARAIAGEGTLNRMYEEKLTKLEKGEFQGQRRKRYREEYQLFLSIALIFLLGETLIDERRKERNGKP